MGTKQWRECVYIFSIGTNKKKDANKTQYSRCPFFLLLYLLKIDCRRVGERRGREGGERETREREKEERERGIIEQTNLQHQNFFSTGKQNRNKNK